jgi:ribosomal protein S18 acetylase RimI-like enzyme
MTDHPLDNVVWAALTSCHAGVARGRGAARHYPRDMAPFAAIATPSAEAYRDLAADLAPDAEARLFRPIDEPTPSGWETLSVRPILQMVAADPDLPAVDDAAIAPLGVADAAAMMALAAAAKPGPFGARTVLLGSYLGVRDADGRLIAMAGERFRLPGYTEVSAVAVHPDARRRGFAQALTVRLMRRIRERGAVPFLHVFSDNPAAALYARWGFRERARHRVVWRRPVGWAPGEGHPGRNVLS